MASYLRVAKPLFLVAITLAGTCLALDLYMVDSNASEPISDTFSGRFLDDRSYVGLRVAQFGEDLEFRVPWPQSMVVGSYDSNGTCIVRDPDAILYVTTPEQTRLLLNGTEPQDPIRRERVGDIAQSACGRDGETALLKARADVHIGDGVFDAAYRDGISIFPYGLDFVFVFSQNVSATNPHYLYVIERNGTTTITTEPETEKTYALVWREQMQEWGGVVEVRDLLADKALRTTTTVAGLVAMLSLPALFLPAPHGTPSPTESGLRLRDAGERHLRRLRNAWLQVGALLLLGLVLFVILAANTVFDISQGETPTGSDGWGLWFMAAALLLGLAVLAAWVAGLWSRLRELKAWRQAWASHPVDSLDDL